MIATSEAEKTKLIAENNHLKIVQETTPRQQSRFHPYSELSDRQKQRRRSELMNDLLLRSGKKEDSGTIVRHLGDI